MLKVAPTRVFIGFVGAAGARLLLLLWVSLWLGQPLAAEAGQGFRVAPTAPAWAGFVAGISTGWAAHEAGHFMVAASQAGHARFNGVTVTYPHAGFSPSQRLRTASAGFQMQWLVSEAVLLPREGNLTQHGITSFEGGMVSAHLAISAAYLAGLYRHPDSDVSGISAGSGVPPGQVVALLALPALIDGWRLFAGRTAGWLPALSLSLKGGMVGWAWQF